MKQIAYFLACVAYCLADVGTSRNQYLPPDKGYNYPQPQPSFGNIPQPQNVYQSSALAPPPALGGPYPAAQNHEDHHHHEPGMPFDFSYSVNDAATANDYAHKAVSDGDVTRGEYRVALPDGRTQIVRYTADWKNGYNAEVTYEGEARYPDAPYGQSSHQQPTNQGYVY